MGLVVDKLKEFATWLGQRDYVLRTLINGAAPSLSGTGITPVPGNLASAVNTVRQMVLALAAVPGVVVFGTVADANANLNYAENTEAHVVADTDPENNGIYRKIGASGTGSWHFERGIDVYPKVEVAPRAILSDGTIVDQYGYDADTNKLYWATDYYGETTFYSGGLSETPFMKTVVETVPRALVTYGGQVRIADQIRTVDGKVHSIVTIYDEEIVFGKGAPGVASPLRLTPFEQGTSPNRSVALAYDDGYFAVSAQTGDQCAPEFNAADEVMAWVRDWGGSKKRVTMPLSFTSSLDAGTGLITLYIGLGQSLMMAQGATPVLHGTAVLPGRAVSFNPGPRILGVNGIELVDTLADYSQLGDFIDLFEEVDVGAGETVCSQIAASLYSDLAAGESLAFANCAIGSASYEQLKKGQEPWSNVANVIGRCAYMARRNGISFRIGGLLWELGHANSSDSVAAHLAKMQELNDDWQALCLEMNNQTGVPIFMVPCGMGRLSRVALAQAQITTDLTRYVIGVCPSYPFPNTNEQYAIDGKGLNPALGGANVDTTHMGSTGQARKGDYYARAIKMWRAGQRHQLLRPISAVRTGANVRVEFNTTAPNFVGPLNIDTGSSTGITVANETDGKNGVYWKDDGNGNACSISTVGVSSNGLDIVLSTAAPTGTNPKIQIAVDHTDDPARAQGPTVGARSQIRDSRVADPVTVNATSYAAPNWATGFEIAVT